MRRGSDQRLAAPGRPADTVGGDRDGEILELLDWHLPLAIERLYDMCGAQVYSVALALVREEATAERLTLNAFLAVWHGARPCPDCGSLAGWMVATVLRDARGA